MLLIFCENHANDGELLVHLVFARDDFALDDLAIEFLHEEFELALVEPKPYMPVGRAEGFFFMLGQVEECQRSTRFQDADGFLEGKPRVCCMVEHLAHEHEVCEVFGQACLRHVGYLGRYVLDVLLLQDFLQAADDFRVAVKRGDFLAAVGKHQREVPAFAATDIYGVLEGLHELAEQANLRLEASAGLVQLVDLPLGLVGAFLQYLVGTAAEYVLVGEFPVCIADYGKYSVAHQEFFAQAVVGLDTVAAVF